MRDDTYPGSYESHLRRRVKELEREVERLKQEMEEYKEEVKQQDELLDYHANH